MAKPRLFVEAGQRVGHGVVIEPEIRVKGYGRNKTQRGARLLCDCGTEYTAPMSSIAGISPATFSCGCLSRAQLALGRIKGPEALRGKRPTTLRIGSGRSTACCSCLSMRAAGNTLRVARTRAGCADVIAAWK